MAASCDVWEFPNEVRPGCCGRGRGWPWCPDRFPAPTWPTCHHTLPFHSVPTSAQCTGWSIMWWWDEMILFYGACRVRVLFWFPPFLILERRGPVVLIPETHFPLYGVTQSWPVARRRWPDPCNITRGRRGSQGRGACQHGVQTTLSLTSAILAPDKLSPLLVYSLTLYFLHVMLFMKKVKSYLKMYFFLKKPPKLRVGKFPLF